MDDGGWDLQAVVRGCCFAGSAATADPFSSFPPSLIKDEPPQWEEGLQGFPTCFPQQLGSGSTGLEELDELCKSFFSEPKQQPLLLPQRSSPSPSSSPANPVVSMAPAIAVPERTNQPRQPQRPISQMSRSKRRKNQQKRVVCHVPADGLSSDMWAWRKYGQKPIKGSPYPRGYYRCSSSKGCLARKQVERSRTDPSMFIITYTAEHNHPVPTHRNSLAGSTRTKFPSPSSAAASTPSASGGGEQQPPPVSSPLSTGLSPTTPLTASMEDELLRPRRGLRKAEDVGAGEEAEEEEEEEEGVLMVEDIEVMGEDDFVFMGLDELGGTSGGSTFFDDGGAFDDHLFPPLWLSNNSNTAAAAGGS